MKGLLSNITSTPVTSLVGLLLLSSLSVSLLLSSQSANALSPYDDTLGYSSTAILSNPTSCSQDEMNISSTYDTVVEDALVTAVAGGVSSDKLEDWQNKTDFVIEQIPPSMSGGHNLLSIYWTVDPLAYGEFETVSGQDRLHTHGDFHSMYLTLGSWYGNTCNQTPKATVFEDVGGFLNADGVYGGKLFRYTPPVVWPEDYEGEFPPTDVTVVRPNYKYCTQLRNLTLTDQSEDVPDLGDNYTLYFAATIGTFETGIETIEGTVAANGSQTMTFNATGPMVIQAWYADLDGQILEDSTYYDFRETDVTTSIGGETKCASTIDGECDAEDLCNPPTEDSKYEDCSVHNIEISTWSGGPEFQIPTPATIGCMVSNFWLIFQDFLTLLFVPDEDNMEHTFGIISDGFKSTLGFIYQSVEFGIDLVTAFVNPSTSTSICNWSFGNVFNNDFKLNFCSFEQRFPSAFTTVQFIIQAFTVFLLVSGLYSEYRRVLTQ